MYKNKVLPRPHGLIWRR